MKKFTQLLDNLFDKNETTLNAMVLFLSRKSQGEPNHIQLRDLDATYGAIVEQAINAKLDDTNNKTLLGQRCDFVEPIVEMATKAIAQTMGGTRNEKQDADLVKQILEKARVQGRIFKRCQTPIFVQFFCNSLKKIARGLVDVVIGNIREQYRSC